MKFTLGWLKDHLETRASLAEIAEKLTALGLEVERLEDRAAAFAPFRVAYVEKAEKHPDADRLKVCIVDTGVEKLQVVCGAPNARAGMKGVFAPAGSVIPGTGVELKKGVIRGQESNGMLVSEREMGLSDAHEGIIEVGTDVPLGTQFAALYGLDDPVIEINLTPNRADCAGVRGIARDLAAAGLGTLKPLDENAVAGTYDSPVAVSIADEKACPLFVGRYIRGVRNGPSPDWLQKRLKAIGLRPISALVDITNYVSYDLCRPLHVFDARKIKGNIHVRLAKKGETLTALNDRTYDLDEQMTVVGDDENVLALGGVMGGGESGCTPDTVDVFLECACFDQNRTARTGRTLQIVSDARYRFERGVDPAFTIPAAEIATRLILELCGGSASKPVIAGKVPAWERTFLHDPSYVRHLSGLDVPSGRQKDILSALGFSVEEKGEIWNVRPPSWRGDIEGRADLVEEIVRVTGYDSIPPVPVVRPESATRSAETPSLARVRKARTALAARGLEECVTWSFMPHERAERFGGNDNQAAQMLRIVNPISADLDRMRPSLLANLIEAAGRNHDRGHPDAALFEVGPAFVSVKTNGQMTVAAGIRAGANGPRHWSGPDASRAADCFDVRADAAAILESCGMNAGNLQITREAPDWYHPGRSGVFRLGPVVIAHFGELHPACLEFMGVREAMSGFEVFLDRIPQPRRKTGTAGPLPDFSPFQPVRRDFAFVVDESISADTIVKAALGADKTMIARADVFDVYTGKGMEGGKKSVAINVLIQPVEATLSDAALESLAARVIAAVTAKTGGTLRG